MARGLVRKNNLSDLPLPEQARINLGLATADANRIKGLFSSASVQPGDVQKILVLLVIFKHKLTV